MGPGWFCRADFQSSLSSIGETIRIDLESKQAIRAQLTTGIGLQLITPNLYLSGLSFDFPKQNTRYELVRLYFAADCCFLSLLLPHTNNLRLILTSILILFMSALA